MTTPTTPTTPTSPTSGSVTTEELHQLIEDSAVVVVDALPRSYYDTQHLPGALNLAPDEVRTRATEVLPDRGVTVVTYCSGPSCSNSTQVAQQLRTLGYSDVRAYHGGIEHWTKAGLPLQSAQG